MSIMMEILRKTLSEKLIKIHIFLYFQRISCRKERWTTIYCRQITWRRTTNSQVSYSCYIIIHCSHTHIFVLI